MKMKRNTTKAVLVPANPTQRTERSALASQHERDDLLTTATYALVLDDRKDPAKVTAVAEALLAWLDESANVVDRAARRAALNKVGGTLWGNRQSVSASELIERASVYYRFIAA